MSIRASTHNGRAGKSGAYSAKHNDRQFDTSTTNHIDPTLTPQNKNVRFGGDYGATTNEAHELAFYQNHFGESLERKNIGYKAKGKAGQIKTMEQYYRSIKSCPEETLYTVGKDIDPQLLWEIYREHQEWKAREFPQCQTLDAALHVDEPNAMPHIHERSVWIGHDAQGKEVVGQAKALAEMGVLPPDPGKKYGKYNNAKQTYTQICRAHFIEVCQEHGLEIEVEPLPPDKVGLELIEYKIQHAQERAAEAIHQAQKAVKAAQSRVAVFQAIEGDIADLEGIQPQKTLTGAIRGISMGQVEQLKAAAIRGVVAEQEVRELKVENRQLRSRLPSTREKLKEAQELEKLRHENRVLRERVRRLESALDFLCERLPEPLQPLISKVKEILTGRRKKENLKQRGFER